MYSIKEYPGVGKTAMFGYNWKNLTLLGLQVLYIFELRPPKLITFSRITVYKLTTATGLPLFFANSLLLQIQNDVVATLVRSA